jgi:DNA-directed RNA polymerase specialized sigma24 family protein
MNPEERVLLRRIAQGDRAAMDDYYRAFQEKIYRFACAQLDDTFAASDVLDEVMLHVWRNARRLADTDDPLAAVLSVTHQLAGKVARVPMAPEIAASGEGVRMHQRIGALPVSVRAALHLALAEDWSHARVARAMNCKEATVRDHLRAATEWIRAEYSEVHP